MGRAVLVLALFVVATVLLLGLIHSPSTNSAKGTTTGSTSTTPSSTTAMTSSQGAHPTTTGAHPPGTVPVLVANASGASGEAASVTNQLQVGGWAMQPPVNASARVPTSHVYYVAGQQQAASSIASALHLPASAVVPYTTAAPISSIGTAEVVVVVGADYVSGASTTTTTTAAAHTSTTAN